MSEIYKPFRLKPNRVSYLIPGGNLINRFLGLPEQAGEMASQMWMASAVHSALDENDGISEVFAEDGGGSFAEVLAANPEAMLGRLLTERFGITAGILLKLLNSDDRLLVQTHPDSEKAKQYFNLPFGKTECWYVLDTSAASESGSSACIWAGFKPGVTREKFRILIEKQDTEGILDSLHRFAVHIGDVILIRAGEPHALGSHSLVAELQEPVDITLRAERFRPDGSELPEASLHSGIGMEGLLDCFHFQCEDRERTRQRLFVRKRIVHYDGWTKEILIGPEDTPAFGMNRLLIRGQATRVSSTLTVGLVLSGSGVLSMGTEAIPLKKGTEFFIPAAAGPVVYTAAGQTEVLAVLECRPPC